MRITNLFIGLFFLSGLQAQAYDPYVKAMAELLLNHPDRAVQYLDTAIAAQPGNTDYILKRADILFSSGDILKAMADYTSADKIEEGRGFYGLARCNAALKNNQAAINFLKKHLESKYKLSRKDIKLDPAFENLENTKEWKILWEKEWYNTFDSVYSDASFMINNKEYTDAINLLTRTLKGNQRKHELLALRAKAYFEMGSFKNALDDLNDAIEIHKKTEYLKARGDILFQMKDYVAAANDYSAVLRSDSSNFSYLLKRAEAYQLIGKYEGAIADAFLYSAYLGYSEQASFIAAQAMYGKGDYLLALGQMNKILEQNKINPRYFMFRGDIFFKTSMYKYSIREYGMALDLDQKISEAWIKRGQARLATGDKNGACHDFSAAVRLNNNDGLQLLQKHCLN